MISKENNFDFIRLFMSILVLYGHSYLLYYGPATQDRDFMYVISSGQIDAGTFAVPVFFIMSGYLITASWQNTKNLRKFLEKRIFRIYPAVIVSILLTIYLIGFLVSSDYSNYLSNLEIYKVLKSIFIMYIGNSVMNVFSNLPYSSAVNGSLWTLMYEFFCYLMIAFLGYSKLLNKRNIILIFIVFYLLSMMNKYTSFSNTLFFFKSLPDLALYFFAGTLYFYRKEKVHSLEKVLLMLLLLALFTYVGYLHLVLVFVLYEVLFYISYSKYIKLHNFAKRGDFSYGVYIYAFPIQQTLIFFWRDDFTYCLFLVTSTITSLFLAILSWKIVEKPSIDFARNMS